MLPAKRRPFVPVSGDATNLRPLAPFARLGDGIVMRKRPIRRIVPAEESRELGEAVAGNFDGIHADFGDLMKEASNVTNAVEACNLEGRIER